MGKLLFAKFARSNFEVLKTSATALLLLLIENHLETQFVCPGSKQVGIAYSAVFIIAPCVPLFFLHIRLSTHCKFSDISCEGPCKVTDASKPCSGGLCCYYLFEFLYALTMPLCWILIVAIDGRYTTCFYEVYQVNGTTTTSMVPIIQMSGLVVTCGILTLLLIKPCDCLVACWRKRSCVEIYYRKKHEHLMLKEVKSVTDKKVADNRNTYVKGIVDKNCSSIVKDQDKKDTDVKAGEDENFSPNVEDQDKRDTGVVDGEDENFSPNVEDQDKRKTDVKVVEDKKCSLNMENLGKRKTDVKVVEDKKCSLNMEDPDTLIGVHTITQKSKEEIKTNLAKFKETKSNDICKTPLLPSSSTAGQATGENQRQEGATGENNVPGAGSGN